GARHADNEEIRTLVESAIAQSGKRTVLRRLDDALLNIDLARISTIHGFCSRILNEFAFETRSSFGMELIKNQDEVIHQILSDFWRREIAPLEPRLFQFVEHLTPESLYEEFKGLMAFPGIEVKGPSVTARDMDACFMCHDALGVLWNKSREEVLTMLSVSGRFKTKAYEPTPENLAVFASTIDQCFADHVLDISVLELISFTALDKQIYTPMRKQFTLPRLPIFVKAQEFIDRFGSYPETFAASMKKRAYGDLTVELKRRLAALRMRSYNTMISDLADSLRRDVDSPASLIRRQFSAVLVDEFQDTDDLQYTIFHTLFFGRDDVFFAMIGDPKQAIYRFRGGDINTYVRARNEVPDDRRFTLSNNYRSERRLIDAINRIYAIDNPLFESDGPFLTPEIGYINVTHKRDIPSPMKGGKIVPPVMLWNVPDGENPDDRVIGRRMARTIAELMDPDDPLIIGHDAKRLRLSDIAILVSSHRSAANYKKLLAQSGIRSVIAKSGSVFDSREADELLLLMEAMLNPSKEATVRALLTSSLFGFDLDALDAWEQNDKMRIATLNELHEAKEKWTIEGIAPAINRMLTTAGVFAISNDPKDELTQERRITNFRHLIELLHLEDLRVGRAPDRLMSSFIRMKMEADESTDNEEIEQRLESDYDAVQIFTMHKAKGLQWPVVFAPDLHKDSAKSNKKGITPIYYENGFRKADLHPERQEEIRQELQIETRQERMRVAYVTLTRAESLLFVVTANRPSGPKTKRLPDMSPAALLLRSPELEGQCDADGHLFCVEEIGSIEEPVLLKTQSALQRERGASKWEKGRELKAPWTIGSYSGLIRGISHEPRSIVRDAAAPEGIFAFPRGADAGTALHTVFERIDFMDVARLGASPSAEIIQLIEGVLADNGISPRRDPENVTRVIEMLQLVLRAKIPEIAPDFRLGDLRADDRLAELEFHLSAGHPGRNSFPVTGEDLRNVIGAKMEKIPSGKNVNGFLTGFIDLVFRHDGKWYILDWKSNHLGNSADCYNRSAMEEVMRDHHYHLQYHIYIVALVRYLRAASGGAFDYERDFGGIVYVFLRGVDGTGNGIYFERPEKDVILHLEAML
ncbi:MAG TPA: UvrD-helicase domain-containing protein, partial [Bacteroidota bacterium]|nr:UvrD-helicase domain-containing protein [Bacteroidota bacterium]